MANTKREVWEAAKAANLDEVIGKISAVFGADAIDGVAVSAGNIGTLTTDDRLLPFDRERIGAGATLDPAESKRVREAHRVKHARLKK